MLPCKGGSGFERNGPIREVVMSCLVFESFRCEGQTSAQLSLMSCEVPNGVLRLVQYAL